MPEYRYARQRLRVRPSPDVDEGSRDIFTISNWSWAVAVGVFIIHLTVPTLPSAYGVLLWHLIETRDWQLWHGLLPPVVFLSTCCVVVPLFREGLSGQSFNSRKVAVFSISLVAGGIATNVFMLSTVLQILTFGILGGVGGTAVVTQAEAVLRCHFPSNSGLVQVICLLGVTLGCFGIPLLTNGFINQYGISGGLILLCGVVLQALVGAAFLSPPREEFSAMFPGRPRAYTVVNDVEMVNVSPSNCNGNSGHSPLLSSERTWRNPANALDVEQDISEINSPVISLRRKNVHGVDILPEIPEENENTGDSSSGSDSIYNGEIPVLRFKRKYRETEDRIDSTSDSQRVIWESFDNYEASFHRWRNINLNEPEQNRKKNKDGCESTHEDTCEVEFQILNGDPDLLSSCQESNNNGLEPNNITSFSIQTCGYDSNSLPAKIHQLFLCGYCNKHCFYKCYLTVLNLPNDIHFYILVPFFSAVRVPKFFPTVFLHTVIRLCPFVFAVFSPLLTRSQLTASSSQEAAFTVSVAAFGWLCFILLKPCFSETKGMPEKYICLVGCLVSSAAMYTLAMTQSHGYIIIACGFFGLGYGAIYSTVSKLLEMELGIKDMIIIQGSLDVLSGIFTMTLSLALYFLLQEKNGISISLQVLSVIQFLACLMWISFLLIPLIVKIRCIHSNEFHSNNFFIPG